MSAPTTWLAKAGATVRLGRPKFLLGGVVLFGLGTLAAERSGFGFDWVVFAWGQLVVSLIQLMTHYSNDYFDYRADLANPHPTRWSGGSRVLVKGEVERGVALKMALVAALGAIAGMVALLLTQSASWLGVAMLSVMLVLSWSYSSPPLRLHTRGLGEPTVWLVVPVMTPLSGFILQAHTLTVLPVLIVLPLSLLLLAMLLTLELPDEQGDRRVGKISWTVLWGKRSVALGCMLLLLAAFVVRFASEALDVPLTLTRGWLWLVPLALFQLWRLIAGDWRRPGAWSRLEFGSVALFFLAVVADLVALYRTG